MMDVGYQVLQESVEHIDSASAGADAFPLWICDNAELRFFWQSIPVPAPLKLRLIASSLMLVGCGYNADVVWYI